MGTSSADHSDTRPLVLVVEDAVMQRIELAEMLEGAGCCVMAVMTGEEALEVLEAVPRIQAVVADVKLSPEGIDGFALAQKVREEWNIGSVLISGRVGPDAGELPPGAHFLAKPVHEATLVHLVHSIPAAPEESSSTPVRAAPAPEMAAADPGVNQALTPRQKEVLALLVEGKSNRDIAEALNLSEHTVKVHLSAIFRVLGVSSRLEAVLAGMRRLSRA